MGTPPILTTSKTATNQSSPTIAGKASPGALAATSTPAEPIRTESLCVTCNHPAIAKTFTNDPTCFSLTPLATQQTAQQLFTQSTRIPTSVLITQPSYESTDGPPTATLYSITFGGAPVTADELNGLCNGAPFVWQPRQLHVTDAPGTLAASYGALYLFTADGGVYSAVAFDDEQTSDFLPSGSRTEITTGAQVWAHLDAAVAADVDLIAGRHTEQCSVVREPQDMCSDPLDAQFAAMACGADVSEDPDTQCAEPIAESWQQRQLAVDFGAVRALYPDALPDPTLDFIPAPLAGRDADTRHGDLPGEETITVNQTFFDNPVYSTASPDAQRYLRGALLAHELGHIYEARNSGLGTLIDNNQAINYGLPAEAVYTANEYLALQHASDDAAEQTLTEMSLQFSAPQRASNHAPGTTEIMAYLYELDFLVTQTPKAIAEESSIQAWEADIEQGLTESATAIARGIALYPETGGILNTLSEMILFNPHLSAQTKQFGVAGLADIVRALPQSAQARVIDQLTSHAARCLDGGMRAAGYTDTRAIYKATGYMADAERCDLVNSLDYIRDPKHMTTRYTTPLVRREDREAARAYVEAYFAAHPLQGHRPRKPSP